MEYGFDSNDFQYNDNKPPKKKGINGLLITNIILLCVSAILILSCIFVLSQNAASNFFAFAGPMPGILVRTEVLRVLRFALSMRPTV